MDIDLAGILWTAVQNIPGMLLGVMADHPWPWIAIAGIIAAMLLLKTLTARRRRH